MVSVKKKNITLIVIVVMLAFPTPHPRTRHEAKYATGALDVTLPIDETINFHWVLHGWHKITIILESTTEIRVTFKTAFGALYNLTKTEHSFSNHDNEDTIYDISITNPFLTGDDAPAIVSGNMSADEIIQYHEWSPWLFP